MSIPEFRPEAPLKSISLYFPVTAANMRDGGTGKKGWLCVQLRPSCEPLALWSCLPHDLEDRVISGRQASPLRLGLMSAQFRGEEEPEDPRLPWMQKTSLCHQPHGPQLWCLTTPLPPQPTAPWTRSHRQRKSTLSTPDSQPSEGGFMQRLCQRPSHPLLKPVRLLWN